MAKIVIIAPSDTDVTDAVKLLKGAGHDVDIEEPTPKSLLHIVLGLMGPNAYGFGSGYAYTPGPEATDDEDEGVPVEGEATAGGDEPETSDIEEVPDDGEEFDFNFESIGTVSIDNELVEAVRTNEEQSTLIVTQLAHGPKTSYRLNESAFSFWPHDVANPIQRVDVHHENVHTSLEVLIKEGEKEQLLVGTELAKTLQLESKSEKKYHARKDHQSDDGTWFVDDPDDNLVERGLQDWEAKELASRLNGNPKKEHLPRDGSRPEDAPKPRKKN